MKRFLPLAIGVAVAVVCVRLGVWQLHRLGERRARNAVIAARLTAPPIVVSPLTDLPPAAIDTLVYRRAVARGTFDFARQVVVVARSVQGVPAVTVVTPLRLEDGSGVLVERGNVPSPDGRQVDLQRVDEPDSAEAWGVLVRPGVAPAIADTGWPVHTRSANPDALAARFPYPLFRLVLRRDSVAIAHSALRAVPLPPLTNGPHLSYAIQWFAFATIALVGGALLAWRTGARQTDGQRGPDGPS